MSPRSVEFPVEGLSDGVVRLRPGADSDVERITSFCRDPEIVRWTTIQAGQREAQTAEWLHRGAAGQAAGTDLPLVIADEATGAAVGTIGLHEINHATGRAVAGYVVAADCRRRGIGSRALTLLCAFAFETLGLDRVEVTIEPGNSASLATAASVGFKPEGVLRSYMRISGMRRDMVMYSLLPADLRRGT